MLHKTRDLLVRQRTMLINALRAHLAEYGIVTAQGPAGVAALMKLLHEAQEKLPEHARSALHAIGRTASSAGGERSRLERQILAWHRDNETSRRLATIPGIGPITAIAIAASRRPSVAVSIGPPVRGLARPHPSCQHSGGKERQGGISKMGDGYLRRLLVVGATAVMRMARQEPGRQPWLARCSSASSRRSAAVALANKTARIAWAVMARKEDYAASSRVTGVRGAAHQRRRGCKSGET